VTENSTAARRHEESAKPFLLPYTGVQPIRAATPRTRSCIDLSLPALRAGQTGFATGGHVVQKPHVHTTKAAGCKDPIQAAMVGQTAVAKNNLIYNFTNKNRR